ncbi:MAG: dihydroorotase [Chitinophagaceae bacterium]|nr:dihydroorotase [Chitinophagaceae bacterium]
MKILLKKAEIIDKTSPYHQQLKDILIVDGLIANIETDINDEDALIFEHENLMVSVGFVDTFTKIGEPGFEQNETFETAALAAQAGGFTRILMLPNTNPTISNQSQVNYINEKSKNLPVHIHSIGAISKNTEGKELAEMYDMFNHGAIAFSDGDLPVQSAALFLKALQYVNSFNGTLIQKPVENSFTKLGSMNEGIVSTQLGIAGIPSFAEILMIKRDIELLRYSNGRLHISGVSTIKGINLIHEAKKEGLNITCSVTPHHLLFCDEDLVNYDSNLKVNPPLRTKTEMMALRTAVVEGKIDCIASHHVPLHSDYKDCEFDKASFGMINLQTAFSVLQEVAPNLLITDIIDLFSHNARAIFNIPKNSIEVGEVAELTLFSTKDKFVLTKENNKSKSYNTSIFNRSLNGKILGTINKGKLFKN